MQISISGQHISTGTSLQEYVKDRLEESVKKYFDIAVSGKVVFTKQSYLYICKIDVNEGTGNYVVMCASADSDDIYAAFDNALIKIEKQLRKYKDKIKNHRKLKLSSLTFDNESIEAKKYVISPTVAEINESGDNNMPSDESMPVIVAEKPTKIEKLTVSEAVMRMDLQNLPTLLFINAQSGRINVVYHRQDGNISWIDPEI